jgi:hypothetical protein
MKPWKVISKNRKQVDRDSVELHLEVERGGVVLDKIVSGATFYSVDMGGEVMLPDHSGTSEGRAEKMGHALTQVLIRAGKVVRGAIVTDDTLLFAAKEYCEAPALPLPDPPLIEQVFDLAAALEHQGSIAVQMLRTEAEAKSDGDRIGLIALAVIEAAIEELQ